MRSGGCSVPEAVGVQWELPGAVARRDQSQALLAGRGHFMRSSRPSRAGSPGHSARGGLPALMALPALLRASHLLGLALGSALGRLRDSGVTLARMFEKAEESALLLRMTREAAGILGARWDKVPERHRPHYAPKQRFRILRIRSFLGLSQRETAEMFWVATDTIARWEMETTTADGEAPRPAPHYAHFRPHQGVAGATPAEVYFGRTPAHLSAIPPPRARPGEGQLNSPFRVEYLDAERLLPVLVRKAA